MKIYIITLLLCAGVGSFTHALAQYTLSGRVQDATTEEALVGVTVTVPDTPRGTITDPDGRFTLSSDQPITTLTLSSVGYRTRTVPVEEKIIQIALTPTTTALNPVIVSASRDTQRRTDAPVAVGTVSPQLLAETKPTSLDQVLNKVSGVFMVDLGNEQHSMSVRQPLSYKSLFLYLEDGLPIRPTGVFNHNALIEMNMGALQTIEVIRGPASSLYGSEAIGGALNFITQRASAVPTARLTLQADNQGYRRTDFGAATSFDNGLGVSLGGYYAQRRHGFRDYSDFRKLAVTATVDYAFGADTKLETTTSVIDYRTDMTGSLDSASFFGQEYSSLHTFTERTVRALRTQWRIDHRWSARSHSSVRLFFRDNAIGQIPSYRVRDDQNFSNPEGNPNLARGEVNENRFRSYGALAQHNQNLPWLAGIWRVGASLDYSPASYFAHFIRIDRSDDGVYTSYTPTDSVLTRYDVDLRNSAVYTQLELSPLADLRVVAALRYDHFRYDYDNYLSSDAFSGAPDAVNSFRAFTPKVGFTYDFGQQRGVYANYSVGFVPPQVGELYRGVRVPTLEPAVYRNYEVGGWISLFRDQGSLEVSLYQLNGTDEIISVQVDDGATENRNAGQTRHRGVEYNLRVFPVPDLKLRVSGTNAWHTFVDFAEGGNDFSGNRMNRAPWLVANSEVTYRPSALPGLRVALEWQHMNDYYLDEANTEKYDGFDVFNARAGYTFWGVEVWTNVLNVADVLYATNASRSRWGESYSPGLPRTFQLGIGYQLTGQ